MNIRNIRTLILTRILERDFVRQRGVWCDRAHIMSIVTQESKSRIISIIVKLSARKGKDERDCNATKFYLVWSH